jgi:HAD superfamily hydrolase (TIGR01509 family)
VLVDSPHEKAWREALRGLMEGEWGDLRERTKWSPDAFTPEVYEKHVSGRPRMEGARAALAYFEVPDEDGVRVQQYADAKQAMVERLIEARDFHAYEDAVRFALAVKEAGLRIATASSSKNAALLLRQIPVEGGTLLELFDGDVSGRDFAHGKPAPDIFLAAAQAVREEPARSVVIEDAPAGVEAAKAGNMGAIGISRHDDAELLERAGADLVVTSLDDVDVDALASGRIEKRS